MVPVGGKAPGLGDDASLGAVKPVDVNNGVARAPFGFTFDSQAFGCVAGGPLLKSECCRRPVQRGSMARLRGIPSVICG